MMFQYIVIQGACHQLLFSLVVELETDMKTDEQAVLANAKVSLKP